MQNFNTCDRSVCSTFATHHSPSRATNALLRCGRTSSRMPELLGSNVPCASMEKIKLQTPLDVAMEIEWVVGATTCAS